MVSSLHLSTYSFIYLIFCLIELLCIAARPSAIFFLLPLVLYNLKGMEHGQNPNLSS